MKLVEVLCSEFGVLKRYLTDMTGPGPYLFVFNVVVWTLIGVVWLS